MNGGEWLRECVVIPSTRTRCAKQRVPQISINGQRCPSSNIRASVASDFRW